MTTQLDLNQAVIAAGGERLAGLVPGLDLEHFLDHGGSIDEDKVADLVSTLLPPKQKPRGGRDAGLAEARKRFGTENTTKATVPPPVMPERSAAALQGLAESQRRFGVRPGAEDVRHLRLQGQYAVPGLRKARHTDSSGKST